MEDKKEILLLGKGISKIYQNGGISFHALNGVDIEIPKGSLVILKGRSGSGKTTLINILSSLDKVDCGEVIFDNESFNTLSEKKLEKIRRYNMGFVFQSYGLIPIMNGYENVEFSLRLTNFKGDREERVKKALGMVGLYERRLHMPTEMSGGEKQRIAIARAIVHSPKIVFADEPTGALDTESGLFVMTLFRRLVSENGLTVVMTTHDENLMEMGDLVYELEDGEIVGKG